MTTTDEPHLWAIDLDTDRWTGRRWPCGAHLIVSSEDAGYGEVRTGACGQTFTRGTHPHGWWSTKVGHLPLAEHAVHCGADVVLNSNSHPD